MQTQQAASESRQEVEAWANVVQQLGSDPLHSVDAGQAVVASVLGTLQCLGEQRRHAFDDLAGRDDALATAEARIGGLHC